MGGIISIVLLIAFLLAVNAVLHLIQPFRQGFNKTTIPVFIWGLLLLVLAFFWFKSPIYNWIRWATFILPLVGGTGLFLQLKKSANPKWLDYSILGLDITVVLLVFSLWFF